MTGRKLGSQSLVVRGSLGRQAISGPSVADSSGGLPTQGTTAASPLRLAVVGQAADARRPWTGSDERPARVNIAPRRVAAASRSGPGCGRTARAGPPAPPSGTRGSARARRPARRSSPPSPGGGSVTTPPPPSVMPGCAGSWRGGRPAHGSCSRTASARNAVPDRRGGIVKRCGWLLCDLVDERPAMLARTPAGYRDKAIRSTEAIRSAKH
jgi:hypothetical protein